MDVAVTKTVDANNRNFILIAERQAQPHRAWVELGKEVNREERLLYPSQGNAPRLGVGCSVLFGNRRGGPKEGGNGRQVRS
jgi:hypothetical protein